VKEQEYHEGTENTENHGGKKVELKTFGVIENPEG